MLPEILDCEIPRCARDDINKKMKQEKDTLKVTKATQIKVAEELIESSRLDAGFYLMLILSAVVVTLGLLVDNIAVVIGGMLITPLLTPMLTLSLGIVLADVNLIWRSVRVILTSAGIVVVVSFFFSFLFPGHELREILYERLSVYVSFTYFLVAFTAGLAATFSWAKKNLSAMLPGVAIAVSILPPLSIIGIGLSVFSLSLVRVSLVSFILNLLGIILGSVIVFSLLRFYKSREETARVVKKEIKEEEEKNGNKKIDKAGIKKEIKEQVKKEVEKEIKNE